MSDMTRGRLVTALSNHLKANSQYVFSEVSSYPLFTLLTYIYFIPFSWRKLLLNACRIQESFGCNVHLQKGLEEADPQFIGHPLQPESILSLSFLTTLFDNLYDSSLCCSILSYFCRAENTALLEETDEIRNRALEKEIKAALHFESHEQRSSLLEHHFVDGLNPLRRGAHLHAPHVRLTVKNYLIRGLDGLRSLHSRQNAPLLFPYYNGTKNLGHTTQEALYTRLGGGILPDTLDYSATSLDLLKWYHRTGEQIHGPMEVRVKWGGGDLAPRVYYALGGSAYWAGLFIKPIANYLCTILPSINPETRYDVSRLPGVTDDTLLVTYDYTSFTTSLSDLKFFLHTIAKELRHVPLKVLDVHLGIVEIDLGEYLDTYNDLVNLFQEFDLRRVLPMGVETLFHQGRNGSLGTQGNITFSLAFHGMHIGCATQTPEKDSIVGDDALIVIVKSLLPLYIAHINELGLIQETKFTTISKPPPDDPTEANRSQFKYLKRPLHVDYTGAIRIGVLDAFPDLSSMLFERSDGFHDPPKQSATSMTRLRKFCTQWGRFLTRHQSSVGLNYTGFEELQFIMDGIRMVYDKYELPQEGGIPGTLALVVNGGRKQREKCDFFIPPCDDAFLFEEDWVEVIYSRLRGQYFSTPVRINGVIPLDPYARAQSRGQCTSGNSLLRLMEALEYVTSEVVTTWVTFDEEYASRLRGYILSSDVEENRMLVEVTWLRDPPDWYFVVCLEDMPPIPEGRDPLEVWERLTSVLSIDD